MAYKIKNQHQLHFLTLTVVDWVDVFTRNKYKDLLLESLTFCMEKKGLHLCAWVFMSNHIHLIAYADKSTRGLSSIIADFKKFSSRAIIHLIKEKGESRRDWMLNIFASHGKNNAKNKNYQFWTQYNHPVELISPEWTLTRLNYIHNNPVRAHIVAKPEDYLHSSAIDYHGEKGLLNIELLDIGSAEGFIFMR